MALTAGTDFADTTVLRQLQVPSPCTVLVVDDDDLVRERLCSVLRRAGYEVAPAASGEEAPQLLSSLDCRIVVADWQMPGVDGLALCRYVRLKHSVKYIYFLMLTVRGHRRDVLKGLAAGADDYIIKGAPMEEILARLEVGRRLTHLEHSLRVSNQENRRLAVTDALTGALNRRYMTKYLPREIERARRSGLPLAVLSCDIDSFKQVNDTFGHRAGDEVLQWFVRCAHSGLRDGLDWVARIGGDEFVLILPETTLLQSAAKARILRAAFAEQPVVTCAGALSCTVSIGSAVLEAEQHPGSISAIELLRAADYGLYASKRGGRNQTTAVSPADPEASAPTLAAPDKHVLN